MKGVALRAGRAGSSCDAVSLCRKAPPTKGRRGAISVSRSDVSEDGVCSSGLFLKTIEI